MVKGSAWSKTARDLPHSLVERLRLARSWLDSCRETHVRCPAVVIDQLPKRVLLLGENDQDIRLLETASEQGGYAALSYCWGTAGNIKTIRENLAERLKQIDPREVPKTILDAIHITRSLGLRYLWVDSLCIIQQDDADWQEQGSLMGDIYAKAAVVIAAHSSADAHGGCLSTDHSRNEALATFTTILDGETATISIRKDTLSSTYGQTPAHCTGDSGWESKLESRGWTLQENILAKRILHCTRSEIAWQCSHMICECSAESDVEFDARFSDPFTKLLGRNPQYKASDEDSPSSLREELLQSDWRKLVELYTSRSFTFPEKDRLPALAGIISTLSQAAPTVFRRTDYMFGLWRKCLVSDLLWCRAPDDTTPPRRLSQDTAPSWSWASLSHGSVAFPTNHNLMVELDYLGGHWQFKQACRVENVVCSPKSTQHVFGSTGSGRIEILAKVEQISLDRDAKVEGKNITLDAPNDIDLPGTFYTVVLGWVLKRRQNERGTAKPHGLVLVESRLKGSFERVGYFQGPDITPSTVGSIRGEKQRVNLI